MAVEQWQRAVTVATGPEHQKVRDLAPSVATQAWQRQTTVAAGEPWKRQWLAAGAPFAAYQVRDVSP
jgi:hypothetical protein